jgi:4-amino-4-deoxy-L-arabinose transferase-like glycosyltransferase
VLAVVGAAAGWNLQGWPGRVNDDEGTYVTEAWAVLYPHHLSHYTYWYDHPPFGWIQMAAYIGATDGFARDASAVMAGREYMWLATMISALLIFALCRRLNFRRSTAAATVLLFGLSPLAVYFHRMVSLDNIGTMWLLATLTCAASRRRSVLAAFGAAVCMAGAILSKETTAVMLPTVLWVLWQHTHERTRRWNLGVFFVTLTVIVAVYPLFAILRGELLPGKGHVSLGWALWWQFFGRTGSGSLLDPHSGTYSLAHFWANRPVAAAGGRGPDPAGLRMAAVAPAGARPAAADPGDGQGRVPAVLLRDRHAALRGAAGWRSRGRAA